ncbi:hypothetical protein DPEC_G00036900 [Dallia pectoralis]|uniref:Uncharacterized protein n=1 Tax=Dallia pectoralis TaxID=75939 RepID=A0ACC2HEE5_DALPE|nr:hypothetical protein DPEC_G00036900 [Dallia pectoralis]
MDCRQETAGAEVNLGPSDLQEGRSSGSGILNVEARGVQEKMQLHTETKRGQHDVRIAVLGPEWDFCSSKRLPLSWQQSSALSHGGDSEDRDEVLHSQGVIMKDLALAREIKCATLFLPQPSRPPGWDFAKDVWM